MPVSGSLKKYCISEGAKLDLSTIPTNDCSLFGEGGKEEHYPFLNLLTEELRDLQSLLISENKHRVLVVFQAMDTGGKDGTVKKVFSKVDPQAIHVEAFKKPTEEELARDFLWRAHAKVPRNGQIVVFNRSHYEDIIAVRVKELYAKEVWKRRYRHIVEFERMLAEEGTTIIKFFLHISKDEQKERLQSRLDNPHKHWKFNPDDLKDRARWDGFQHAYEDLIEKTSKKWAPWYVIPADRKWYRNLVVARIVVDTLKGLDMRFAICDWLPEDIVIE